MYDKMLKLLFFVGNMITSILNLPYDECQCSVLVSNDFQIFKYMYIIQQET